MSITPEEQAARQARGIAEMSDEAKQLLTQLQNFSVKDLLAADKGVTFGIGKQDGKLGNIEINQLYQAGTIKIEMTHLSSADRSTNDQGMIQGLINEIGRAYPQAMDSGARINLYSVNNNYRAIVDSQIEKNGGQPLDPKQPFAVQAANEEASPNR